MSIARWPLMSSCASNTSRRNVTARRHSLSSIDALVSCALSCRPSTSPSIPSTSRCRFRSTRTISASRTGASRSPARTARWEGESGALRVELRVDAGRWQRQLLSDRGGCRGNATFREFEYRYETSENSRDSPTARPPASRANATGRVPMAFECVRSRYERCVLRTAAPRAEEHAEIGSADASVPIEVASTGAAPRAEQDTEVGRANLTVAVEVSVARWR